MNTIVHYTLVVLLSPLTGKAVSNGEHTPKNSFPPEYNVYDRSIYASCRIAPNTHLTPGMPKVYGLVLFKQSGPDEELKVTFRLHGLPPSKTKARAIHIHQFGDLSEGCSSTGGHFNPMNINHPKHPGDFNNFVASEGKIRETLVSKATLFGGLSVLGRAVVIHEKEDDLGRGGDAESLLNGNAGGRLACCVIGLSNPTLWHRIHHYSKRNRSCLT